MVNPDQECGGGRTARRSPGGVGKPQLGPLPAHMESGELEKGAPSSTDLLESYPNALNS